MHAFLGSRLGYVDQLLCRVSQVSQTVGRDPQVGPGVTGQNIPPAGLYPGLKRPRLHYTRVYYGLGLDLRAAELAAGRKIIRLSRRKNCGWPSAEPPPNFRLNADLS